MSISVCVSVSHCVPVAPPEPALDVCVCVCMSDTAYLWRHHLQLFLVGQGGIRVHLRELGTNA